MKVLAALLLSFVISSIGIGQTKILTEPRYVSEPYSDMSLEQTENRIQGSLWEVYSQSSTNESFPDGTMDDGHKKMEFLERFYVTKEDNVHIEIYKSSMVPEVYGNSWVLPKDAVCYGWIEKEKMLLWNSSLISSETRIRQKVLLINEEASDREVRIYSDPELTNPLEVSELPPILYLYKKTSQSSLLGRVEHTDVGSIKEDVLGWVSNERLLEWDSRIVCEPNYIRNEAHARKQQGIKASVFPTKEQALNYRKDPLMYQESAIWNYDAYGDRMDGSARRFPILDIDETNKLMKVVVLGAPGSDYNQGNTLAYAAYEVDDLRSPVFRTSVFLNRGEIRDIIQDFGMILPSQADGETQQRQHMLEAWYELWKSSMGDMDFESFKLMQISRVHEAVFGIPLYSDILKGLTMGDLLIERVLPSREFIVVNGVMRAKVSELKRCFNTESYRYSFRNGERRYYWIAGTDLL